MQIDYSRYKESICRGRPPIFQIIKLYLRHQQLHQWIYTSVFLVVPITNFQVDTDTGNGPDHPVVATLILNVVKKKQRNRQKTLPNAYIGLPKNKRVLTRILKEKN
jgi:hypothetical protein